MGKILLGVWWAVVLILGLSVGYFAIYMYDSISSTITKRSKTITGRTYGFFVTGLIVFIVAGIALIVLGLMDYDMVWYRIGVAGAVAGVFFAFVVIVDEGREIWKAVQTYTDKPLPLKSLVRNEDNGDTLEQVKVVAEKVFSADSPVYKEIDELVDTRMIEIQNTEWGKEMESIIIKSVKKNDETVVRAIADGIYLPRGWPHPCPHCGSQVRFEFTGDDLQAVACICDGECGRNLHMLPDLDIILKKGGVKLQ